MSPHKQFAFSLVEVVLALGITVFGITVIIGLLSVGMSIHHDGMGNTEAANTASRILAVRRAAPTSALTGQTPLSPLNQAWPSTNTQAYVAADGTVVPSAQSAAFLATCRAGTTSYTDASTANVYLSLAWPAAAGALAPNHYEIFTTISW